MKKPDSLFVISLRLIGVWITILIISPLIILSLLVEVFKQEQEWRRAEKEWPEIARRRNEEQAAENARNYEMAKSNVKP